MRFATCNEPWRETPVEEVFSLQKAIEAAESGESIYTSAVHPWRPVLPQ